VHSGGGTAERYGVRVHRALKAYEEAGIRVAFAAGIRTESLLVAGKGQDAKFLASLPGDLGAEAERELPAPGDIGEDDYFALMDEVFRDHRDHPRIDIWFAPPGPQWCSDATWVRIAEAAERYDTRIQTHLLESIFEKQFGARAYGRPTVLHLQELGVLSPRISFAHGVWLTEPEIEALAASGASVSHNPSSNLRLRAGIAPLMAMLSRGLNVGLGLDANALNDDDDMLTEMRMALRLHRSPQPEDVAPTPADVFGMATWRGARLVGDTRLGRIAPGYAADLVLLRLDNVTWPWIAPESDPLELLVCRASSRDVDTVLVDGEVVLRDGNTTRFDAAAAGRELHAALSATAFPEVEATLVARLLPAVEAHYRSWELDEHDPFITYNSRC
jgi:cytosine/adenosine deaminase-related metal-dependent hydrolase